MADQNVPFSIAVDLTGTEPWDPTKGGMTDPEPGAYAGRVVNATLHTKQDTGSQSIKVTVALEGGVETDLYMGTDFSKPSNKQKLATALMSCGVTLSKIPAGTPITPAFFMGQDGKGRPCYVLVKLVDGVDAKGRKKLNDKDWMTKDQYASYKASPAASRPAPASSPATNGAAAPPAAGPDLAGLFG